MESDSPYGLEIRHRISVVFKVELGVDGDGRRALCGREDVFLAPCRINVGVLVFARLLAAFGSPVGVGV